VKGVLTWVRVKEEEMEDSLFFFPKQNDIYVRQQLTALLSHKTYRCVFDHEICWWEGVAGAEDAVGTHVEKHWPVI
jgi:hypothetical protein